MTPWRPLLAEAAGAFALVLVGCGAIMVDALHGGIGHLGVSLAFGLVIGTMVASLATVSGAHFNPAVTLALAVIGRFPWHRTPAYITAQVLGAVAAALLLRLLLGTVAALGATRPAPGLTLWRAGLVELTITAILMFVIAAVATTRPATRGTKAAAIGGTVGLMALVAGPLTGASMNPARSLGPALAGGGLDGIGLYLLFPTLGAIIGALLWLVVAPAPKPHGDPDPTTSPPQHAPEATP